MLHDMTNITSYYENQSESSFYICNLKEALIVYEPIRGKLLNKEPVTGNYNWKWEKKVHDIGANIKGSTECNRGSWLMTRTGLKIDSATFTDERNFKRTFLELRSAATQRIVEVCSLLVVNWTLCHRCFLEFCLEIYKHWTIKNLYIYP